jgi:hypothetical protein
MYFTTALLTGVVILPMLFLAPPDGWTARVIVLPIALVLILGTLPARKGIAIAIEYLVDRRMAHDASAGHEAGPPPTCGPNDDP